MIRVVWPEWLAYKTELLYTGANPLDYIDLYLQNTIKKALKSSAASLYRIEMH